MNFGLHGKHLDHTHTTMSNVAHHPSTRGDAPLDTFSLDGLRRTVAVYRRTSRALELVDMDPAAYLAMTRDIEAIIRQCTATIIALERAGAYDA